LSSTGGGGGAGKPGKRAYVGFSETEGNGF
jgi:hypothetical protein